MRYTKRPDAILLLEDGTVFRGKAAGLYGTAVGEICFNTGMTGYQEIFTDPSYFGQIIVAASVHIGNYGVTDLDTESGSMKISGLVCRYFSPTYSRIAAQGSLNEYFQSQGKVVISDVDTRALVRHIRSKGAMNAIISSEELDVAILAKRLESVPSMDGLELSSKVSCGMAYSQDDDKGSLRVALLDLGVKQNIIRCLNERGCNVKVYPMNTSLDTMLAYEPDGFMISNGPGDPSAMPEVINQVGKILMTGIPVFGICLGHQIIALSQGISTFKMHSGHRGINQPVKNLISGNCEVTSQNHGFVVSRVDCEANSEVEITHEHLNDRTVAGIRLRNRPVFSVQYHPESSPGPNDSRYLFDQFVNNMRTASVQTLS